MAIIWTYSGPEFTEEITPECPECQSWRTHEVSRTEAYTEYNCYDCDHTWFIMEDDDDIPF